MFTKDPWQPCAPHSPGCDNNKPRHPLAQCLPGSWLSPLSVCVHSAITTRFSPLTVVNWGGRPLSARPAEVAPRRPLLTPCRPPALCTRAVCPHPARACGSRGCGHGHPGRWVAIALCMLFVFPRRLTFFFSPSLKFLGLGERGEAGLLPQRKPPVHQGHRHGVPEWPGLLAAAHGHG